jgi:hypothetical protein
MAQYVSRNHPSNSLISHFTPNPKFTDIAKIQPQIFNLQTPNITATPTPIETTNQRSAKKGMVPSRERGRRQRPKARRPKQKKQRITLPVY